MASRGFLGALSGLGEGLTNQAAIMQKRDDADASAERQQRLEAWKLQTAENYKIAAEQRARDAKLAPLNRISAKAREFMDATPAEGAPAAGEAVIEAPATTASVTQPTQPVIEGPRSTTAGAGRGFINDVRGQSEKAVIANNLGDIKAITESPGNIKMEIQQTEAVINDPKADPRDKAEARKYLVTLQGKAEGAASVDTATMSGGTPPGANVSPKTNAKATPKGGGSDGYSTAFDKALAWAKVNDAEAYQAGLPLAGEKYQKLGQNETLIDRNGNVVFANNAGADRETERENRRDERQQRHQEWQSGENEKRTAALLERLDRRRDGEGGDKQADVNARTRLTTATTALTQAERSLAAMTQLGVPKAGTEEYAPYKAQQDRVEGARRRYDEAYAALGGTGSAGNSPAPAPTGDNARTPGKAPAAATQAVPANTRAEYDRLPKGARYVKDGKEYIKG